MSDQFPESADRPDWIRALAHMPVRMWMCPVEEHADRRGVVTVEWIDGVAHCTADRCALTSANVRVGFRYQDGEVLTFEREAVSRDAELPEVVIDRGDGEWLTLAELRDMHAERLEQTLRSWDA